MTYRSLTVNIFYASIQSVRHGVQFDGVDHTVTIQLLVSNLEHLKQRFEELEMEEDTAMKKIEELFKRLEELARIDQAQRDDILHERNNNMLKVQSNGLHSYKIIPLIIIIIKVTIVPFGLYWNAYLLDG